MVYMFHWRLCATRNRSAPSGALVVLCGEHQVTGIPVVSSSSAAGADPTIPTLGLSTGNETPPISRGEVGKELVLFSHYVLILPSSA